MINPGEQPSVQARASLTTFVGDSIPLTERDIARVNERLQECVRTMSGCWLWTGEIAEGGYGRMWIAGRNRRIHRVVYEIHVDQIPPGLVIDHLCRVRNCVNPSHLEVVTPRENFERSPRAFLPDKNLLAHAAARRAITHCVHGHEYSPANTKWSRYGRRSCKECAKESAKRRREIKN